jgi:hypothetical protein
MMHLDLLTNEKLSEQRSLYKTSSRLNELPIRWRKVEAKGFSCSINSRNNYLVCVNRGILDLIKHPHIVAQYKCIFYWLIESREIDPLLYAIVESSFSFLKQSCMAVFCADSQLLSRDPDLFRFVSNGTVSDSINSPPKDLAFCSRKPIKLFCSHKTMCINHKLRIILGQYLAQKHNKINFTLIKTTNQSLYPSLQSQLSDCLGCIVIENNTDPFYFTEKLVACFATKTLPILYGTSTPAISGLDVRGIELFSDISRLNAYIASFDLTKYIDKQQALEANYKVCMNKEYQSLEHQLEKVLCNLI